MKRIIPWAVGIITGLLAFGMFYLPGTAQANETPAFQKQLAGPSFKTCVNLRGWTVNDDETDRLPVPTEDGLQFSGDQLIHHSAADLTAIKIAELKPGSYTASPAPSLDSFFSVEVRDADGAYGTLRWNKKTSEWYLTTNVDTFHHADPADFIGTDTKWGKITADTRVASFGVGYVAHPNDGTKTTVSQVEFDGHKYDLTCKPTPTSSAPTSTKPTSSKPTATKSSSAPAGGIPGNDKNNTSAGHLAITGPSTPKLLGAAGLILVVGVGTVIASRRRRAKFEA